VNEIIDISNIKENDNLDQDENQRTHTVQETIGKMKGIIEDTDLESEQTGETNSNGSDEDRRTFTRVTGTNLMHLNSPISKETIMKMD
jgi:hypothetical protein